MNKSHEIKAIYEVKMGRELKRTVALNGYLDLEGMSLITRKFELHPD